jgi:hypothetical protein
MNDSASKYSSANTLSNYRNSFANKNLPLKAGGAQGTGIGQRNLNVQGLKNASPYNSNGNFGMIQKPNLNRAAIETSLNNKNKQFLST